MPETKKAIVFGGSGFLGSHVADSLTRKKYEVTIFDIKKSPFLQDSQSMVIGDILNQDQLDEVFENQEQIAVSKFYESLPKPWSIAIKELLNDEIYIRDTSVEDDLNHVDDSNQNV